MDSKIKIIKDLLEQIINNIDTGNSNISEENYDSIIEDLVFLSNENGKLSKYQACKYLGISRASFDNYVKDGLLPKGKKQQGFKELFYYKKDLDKFFKNKKK